MGDAGTVTISTDAGTTWSAFSTSTAEPLRDVAFPDSLRLLGHVGRMALTNYIMQAVILTALVRDGVWFARGVAPQMNDVLDGWWRLLLLAAIFALQVLYSRWWFRHFQFGPVEWAWRSLTWLRLQPMRVRAVRVAAA